MNTLFKSVISIALFAFIQSAGAQNSLKTGAPANGVPTPPSPTTVVTAACPAPLEVGTAHVYGLWQVSFFDGPLPPHNQADAPNKDSARTTILFERHPEHTDSLRGAMKPIVSGNASPATGTVWLSGDLEDGELILDESADGVRISAVWVAHPTRNGCGKVFQGNRRLADSDVLQTFTMTKAPGWR